MKKKMLVTILSTMLAVSSLCGCSADANKKSTNQGNSANSAQTTNKETSSAGDDVELVEGDYKIGISQFAEHGSLDNARNGFIEGLASEGFVEGKNLTIEYQNAQTDTGIASTITDSFVSDKVNLICAIATPSAMSAYNSAKSTDIPVIYTAVSDPVAAGLANEDGTSVGNITGTSDYLAVDAQLQMIREILPKAKKIGIIYTTSEANSVSTIEKYKEKAGSYGFEIVEKGISTISDVDIAAAALAENVDCINNLTDNTVVSALDTVISRATEKNIPVFGSEIEQVKKGCVASMGLEYYQLGIQTGKMAAKVLKKESSAKDMKFEVIDEPSLYINTAAAKKISLEISDDEKSKAAEVYDEIISK